MTPPRSAAAGHFPRLHGRNSSPPGPLQRRGVAPNESVAPVVVQRPVRRLLLLYISVGHQSEFSNVRPRMGMIINSYHPTAVVDQRGRLLTLIGRRSDP